MYRIGWLASGSSSGSADVDLSRAFRETLRQLGYTEGRNLLIEQRFAEARSDSLQNSAAQLVGLKVDALLALGTPATLAAMQATKSIPIVMISVGDPVGSGLVSSLGKPGGNVTGLSAAFPDIAEKWAELLKDVVPGISRIGFLGNANNPGNLKETFPSVQAAARVLGLAVDYFSATKPDEVGRALAAVSKARVQGLIVSGDSVI